MSQLLDEREDSHPNDQATWQNQFALKWIDDRLGAEELRHGIILVAGVRAWPAETTSDELAELSNQLTNRLERLAVSNGGAVQYKNQSQVVAFWNCDAHQSAPADVLGALTAASQIVNQACGTTRPCAVLNAGRIHVSRRADGTPEHMTSIATEEALRSFSLARPGEIAISPAADMILASFSRTREVTPARGGSAPHKAATALARVPRTMAETDAMLARDPTCSQLPPSTRAQLAHATGGLPDLACHIGRLIVGGTVSIDALRSDNGRTTAVSVLLSCWLDALGPIKSLVRAAAIFTDEIDIAIMATVFGLDPASVAPLFARPAAGAVFEPVSSVGVSDAPRRLPTAQRYRITSPLLRQAAYRSVPARIRRHLHRDIARAMQDQHAAGTKLDPAAIAEQFARGDQNADAIRWWRQAAEGAIAQSASQTAINHLQTALDCITAAAPNIAARGLVVADLTRLYGPQLSALKGNASQEVYSVYRARAHTTAGSETARLSAHFDSLWGIQTCYLVRGEIGEARRNAPHLMHCAFTTGCTSHRILASRLQGLLDFLLGDTKRARHHYAEVLSLYDPHEHADLRHTYASDQASLAHAHLAWTAAIEGDDKAAQTSANRALETAERYDHPHTQAHTVSVLALANLISGLPEKAMPLAMAGRAIAQRYGFNYWEAWSQLVLAATEPPFSRRRPAHEIAAAIADYRATRARQLLPYAYAMLAQAHFANGNQLAGELALQRGLGEAAETGIAVFSPTLDRLAQRHGITSGRRESLVSGVANDRRIGTRPRKRSEIHSAK